MGTKRVMQEYTHAYFRVHSQDLKVRLWNLYLESKQIDSCVNALKILVYSITLEKKLMEIHARQIEKSITYKDTTQVTEVD
jgi:hypothetical protein